MWQTWHIKLKKQLWCRTEISTKNKLVIHWNSLKFFFAAIILYWAFFKLFFFFLTNFSCRSAFNGYAAHLVWIGPILLRSGDCKSKTLSFSSFFEVLVSWTLQETLKTGREVIVKICLILLLYEVNIYMCALPEQRWLTARHAAWKKWTSYIWPRWLWYSLIFFSG